MVRGTLPITRFNVGEVALDLLGRLDLQHYAAAGLVARNVRIDPTGGFSRRAGTRFLGETALPGRRVRLVHFVAPAGTGAIIEFGHRYLRIWQADGPLRAGPVGTTVQNGEFVLNISTWDDVSSQRVVRPGEDEAARPKPIPGGSFRIELLGTATTELGQEVTFTVELHGGSTSQINFRLLRIPAGQRSIVVLQQTTRERLIEFRYVPQGGDRFVVVATQDGVGRQSNVLSY